MEKKDDDVTVDKDSKPQKLRWLEWESNPDAFNAFAARGGLALEDEGYSFYDVFGFDKEALQMLPSPVVALVLLFPHTRVQLRRDKGAIIANKKKFEKLKEVSAKNQHKPYYLHQCTDGNCGPIATLHALANTPAFDTLPAESVLRQFIEETKSEEMDYTTRGKKLIRHQALYQLNNSLVLDATKPPDSAFPLQAWFKVKEAGSLFAKKRYIKVNTAGKVFIYSKETADESSLEDSFYLFQANVGYNQKEFAFTLPGHQYNIKPLSDPAAVAKQWAAPMARASLYWQMYYSVNPLPEDFKPRRRAGAKKSDPKKEPPKPKRPPKEKKDRWVGSMNHFICFLPIEFIGEENTTTMRICELDGCADDPYLHRETTHQEFLQDCVKVIQEEYMQRGGGSVQFSVIALCRTPKKEQ